MAQRFIEQATQQLAPVYDQQAQSISSQVPAIQNLYNTLIQGLEQSSSQQLQSGVTGIVEDASRRGVLRSSLPVDARQALQGQLSQALLAGRGQLESQRAGDIAGVNEKIAGLGVQRAGNIADLARSLETQDIQRQELAMRQQQEEYERQLAEREFELKKIELSRRSSGSGGSKKSGDNVPAADKARADYAAIGSNLARVRGPDKFVSPESYAAAKQDWVEAGYPSKEFDVQFSNLRNPKNPNYRLG